MSHVTYAGVALYQPTPQVEFDLVSHLRPNLARLWQNSWGDQSFYTRQHWAMASHFPNHHFELGSLYWPVGASRWSYGHWLVHDHDLDTILAEAIVDGVPVPKILDLETVQAPMYLLPSIPEYVSGDCSVRVLTLVDERFWWWYKNADIEIEQAVTTWDDLIDQVGTALGIEILRDTIPAAYLTPGRDLEARQESLPLLLDAIAYNIGRRVVREQDGTVTLMGIVQSRAREEVNLEEIRMVGGDRLLGVDGAERALILPERVTVRFPRPTSGTYYTVSKALTNVGIPDSDDVIGFDGDKMYHDTLIAKAVTGTPSNDSELQALVTQFAADWYRHQLGKEFVQYREIVDILPHGLMDGITWRVNGEDCSTTVYPPGLNDQVEELCHGGKTIERSDSFCVSGELPHVGEACPQVVAVIPNDLPTEWCVHGQIDPDGHSCLVDTTVFTTIQQGDWCVEGDLQPPGEACLILPPRIAWCVTGEMEEDGTACPSIFIPEVAFEWCVSGDLAHIGEVCPAIQIGIACGLKTSTTGRIMVNTADLVTPNGEPTGLIASCVFSPEVCANLCTMKVYTGCGVTLNELTNQLEVNPYDLTIDPEGAPTGLTNTSSSCTLFVNLGCLLKFGESGINDGKIIVDTRLLIGLESPFDGNRAGGLEAVQFEDDCYYLRTLLGCNLKLGTVGDDAERIFVDAARLAGHGAVGEGGGLSSFIIAGEGQCERLMVNCGCGLEIDGGFAVGIKRESLMGQGLVADNGVSNCGMKVSLGNCLEFDVDNKVKVKVGDDGCLTCDENGLKVKIADGEGLLCEGNGVKINPLDGALGNTLDESGVTTNDYVTVIDTDIHGFWCSGMHNTGGLNGLLVRTTVTDIWGNTSIFGPSAAPGVQTNAGSYGAGFAGTIFPIVHVKIEVRDLIVGNHTTYRVAMSKN